MDSDRQRKDRLGATRERALLSPVRSRILELCEKEGSTPHSIAPAQLFKELTGEGWKVSLSQVNYHLRWLADAQLIPAPCHGG